MSTRVTRSASKPRVASTEHAAISEDARIKVDGTKKATKRKATTTSSKHEPSNTTIMPPPATPLAKRARKATSSIKSPTTVQTPTPLEAKVMAGPTTPSDPFFVTLPLPSTPNRRAPRPADPHVTNAPLATPRGSRHVAYERDISPSPTLPRPTATTADILAKACDHLRKTDPRLVPIIDAHPCPLWTPEALATPVEPFRALVSSIMAQQVSGAAAKSIRNKFIALFVLPTDTSQAEHVEDDLKGAFPTPTQVAAAEISLLRTAGLSGRKAEYVKGVAEKFASGELSAEWLARASWDELYERLIAVRGLGKWSVEMFACFALKRMDVFSTGDLGVQRGMAALTGKDVKKLKAKGGNNKWKYMTEKEMVEEAEKFAPYRSLYMWYMWRVEDVDVTAIQDN